MNAPPQANPLTAATDLPVPLRRYVLAWAVLVGGLAGFWCTRPWLGTNAFNFGQIIVLFITWKIASLICLPRKAWARFTPLRFLAYCIWSGMQPRQFLVGERTAVGAPIPTWAGWFWNVVTGVALLWLVPRLLPVGTPWAIRFWTALTGLCFLRLFALCDLLALIFRLMGFPVEKLWDCPVAARSLDDFWGRRWNRIVSGCLREVIFFPVARHASAKVALLAVFAYSGLYHEFVSFMVNTGYGRPFLYFMVQFVGVAIENTRRMRHVLRGRVWLARAWTFAVVFLPVGLFVHPGFVDRYLVPTLVARGVPGLERSVE
jgi:hypothetical protein